MCDPLTIFLKTKRIDPFFSQIPSYKKSAQFWRNYADWCMERRNIFSDTNLSVCFVSFLRSLQKAVKRAEKMHGKMRNGLQQADFQQFLHQQQCILAVHIAIPIQVSIGKCIRRKPPQRMNNTFVQQNQIRHIHIVV